MLPHGGKFGSSNPKSDVEWQIYYASTKPGVGAYNLVDAFKSYVGPGPSTRMSIVGIGPKQTYNPPVLPRKIVGKSLVVTDEVHRQRLDSRRFGEFPPSNPNRDTRGSSLSRAKRMCSSLPELHLSPSKTVLPAQEFVPPSRRSHSRRQRPASTSSAGSETRDLSSSRRIITSQPQGGAGKVWSRTQNAGLVFISRREGPARVRVGAVRIPRF